ncbi:Glycosyl transferase family 11 [Caenorhabditis elegans]|uniref:Glycosyl transferase family 11 n=1 Tax=Caenorhabditis elegans TaxID=6239 RepID=G5EG98_CAEEL|nr:Glycosyl transferase family 11 [Caenorhabditis elegans]CAB04857.3 Glycosyl transferase family 11 [Caenorhabditis elegans]|eukprot:NP_506839.3 Uncharacterized protein CELE_T26H5.8 [Caenorhabditis elegans]
METFQNTKVPPSKCVIDVDHFLEFSENRHVMKLKENELAIINGRTVQTMLYAFPNAGLGNRLFELISLLGIASTLQRRAVINATNPNYMSHLHQTMQPLFPKLVEQFELRVIPESSVARQQINWSRCCIFDDPAKVLDISNQHVILDGHYFQSFKYFHHIRTKIREWMAPKELAKSKAEKLIPFSVKDNFIICPHIRRGDFETDGLHQPSDPTFTRAATDFLVEKYQKTRRHVTVVVFGNDMSFAHTVFEDRVGNISFALNPNATALNYTLPEYSPTYDVILTPQSTPEIDLAFSRTFCDATLFTGPSSTFGWWLSYLAKSSAKVYYRDILETKDGVINDMKVEDFYPPEWIKLRTNEYGSIGSS